jgi:RNA polymerase sigma factor (sigma-70 family)
LAGHPNHLAERTGIVPPQDPEQGRWFAEHLQPYEARLRCWLRSRFPTQNDVDDIIQEAYVRVLRARENGVIDSPKAFLFATARNLAFGRMRRPEARIEESLAEIDTLCVLDANEDVPRAVARAEELELLTRAIQSLPTRCRQVLTLRKLYGLPQKEVARQLGISEHTVEAQGTIGLRKIAEFFESIARQRRPRHD